MSVGAPRTEPPGWGTGTGYSTPRTVRAVLSIVTRTHR